MGDSNQPAPGRRALRFLWRHRRIWIPALLVTLALLAILYVSSPPADPSPFIYRVN
ncbi:MAG TPA: hypothetical protein PLQ97_05575 [Myxococcota bacterium]|nr:hypothetical protein [Myxococcota bacterium]HQK50132.1 hypothetical protein [Myxococcota bacterium]